MSSIWKISVNGGPLADLATLGLANDNLSLVFESFAADTLKISDPQTAFDAAPRWAIDDTIKLTRNNGTSDVPVFVGQVRQQPAFLAAKAERIDYVVKGPWQLLERTPFLQLFSYADTPSSPSTTFSSFPRGIVVLAQADNGASLSLSAALSYVLSYAVISAGVSIAVGGIAASLVVQIPLDQATDLSCAAAIQRLLQWIPDAVCWWDYTVTPPAIHLARRGDLAAKTLAIAPAGLNANMAPYAPAESVRIEPREDLLAPSVSIIYVRTDRVDKVSYEVRSVDSAGSGAVNALGAVVRTIKLAGAIRTDSYVTQDLEAVELPSGVSLPAFAEAAPAAGVILPANAIFSALENFWTRHLPELTGPAGVNGLTTNTGTAVTIQNFSNCVWAVTGGGVPDASKVNYVVSGAITPWMVSAQGIIYEDQEVTIEADVLYTYTVTRPDGSPDTKTIKQHLHLKARITATNAESGTYTFLQSSTYTTPEVQPAGLAAALYAAVSVLHWEGDVVQVEPEASLGIGLGNVLNLTAGRAAWATMVALIQRIEVDVGKGRTTIKIGWPRQLSPADLAMIWRVNRTRAQVTDQAVRTTGISGDADNPQPMAHKHKPTTGSAHPRRPAVFICACAVAGTVPVFSDFSAALASASTGAGVYPSGTVGAHDVRPVDGDEILFTSGGKLFARGSVTAQNIGSIGSNFAGSFTANGNTWYLHVVQTGIYPP